MASTTDLLLRPRETFPRLVEAPSLPVLLFLSSVWGTDYRLRELLRHGGAASDELSRVGLLFSNLAVGIALGIAVTWSVAWVFLVVARRMGGNLSEMTMRAVLAWSFLPHCVTLLVSAGILLTGSGPVQPRGLAGPESVLRMVCSMYSVGLAVVGLSSTAGISTARAIGVYFLGGVILIVLVLACLAVFRGR